jgi:ribulose-phosphate 3-epimerase
MPHLIAPSLLAADFSRLREELEMINRSEADWLHLDIMDGHFVPNISFGPDIVKTAHTICTKPLDVHLMIERPERYIEVFREAGADTINVHLEACTHLHRTVQQIRATGAKAAVTVNPHTNVLLLEDILEELDMVLIMSVNPGYGGQRFIPQSLMKIRTLRQRIIERNLKTLIEVDGGVGLQNAEALLQAGADVLVAGSAVFKTPDPLATIRRFKEIGKDSGTYRI